MVELMTRVAGVLSSIPGSAICFHTSFPTTVYLFFVIVFCHVPSEVFNFIFQSNMDIKKKMKLIILYIKYISLDKNIIS